MNTYEVSFGNPSKEVTLAVKVSAANEAEARASGVKYAREWLGETRKVWRVYKTAE
jgi:hypothetical protein